MIELENANVLRYIESLPADGHGQRWVYTGHGYPAQDVNLRDAQGERFAVLNAADDYAVLEELSSSAAPLRVHLGAVYLHQGESYVVTEYNADMRHAVVTPASIDYYTQSRELNDVRIVRSLAPSRDGRSFGVPRPGACAQPGGWFSPVAAIHRSGAGR